MIKEIILMIMMTGGGDDPVDATFIEVETQTACQERAGNAIKVFPQAGITYVGHYCVSSNVSFSDFLHNPEPTGPKYYFDLLISTEGDRLTAVNPYLTLEACKDQGGKNCVMAYQNIQP